MIAIMFAMIAFGSDAMLPAFPQIAADLGLSDVNRAQLVITIFILGTGLGQLFTGPLSDSLGRKPVILGGLLVYMAGCVLAIYAQSLTMLLLARFVQGIGVSAPRTVTIAMVRDLYAGRRMARVMSLAMTLFVLVPAVAPLIGQSIAASFGWRSIFGAFILFAIFGFLWLGLRQPETLPLEKRRALKLRVFLAAAAEVFSSRIVITYALVLAFGYGALFGYLSSAQQIFVNVFGAGANFPLYFAVIALISGGAGFLNAFLVIRFGMRPIATFAFGIILVITTGIAVLVAYADLSNEVLFPIFLIWSVLSFFVPGLTFGNLTALTMEPMGHIAGIASAIIGAASTLLGVLIAIPIGLAFDGTILPLMVGTAICAGASFALMLSNPKDG
ncbi:MAG: multidrug effflux MFS transporter [Alphaproteobacteria bacterium]|nr:multidrug effflux MFS transporter [Alphaproteobacteria bacterium]